jgi:hypothetical protein
MYMGLGDLTPEAKIQKKEFVWPSTAKVSFEHLHYSNDIYKYQGLEAAYIAFDELTHFEESMFWYLNTRNRSTSFANPFIRATTNPQGDGWVKKLISWYLYPVDYFDQDLADYPITERIGKIRYFRRFEGEMIWGDTVDEVCQKINNSDTKLVRSFTFINGKLEENLILNKIDPTYRSKLESADETERMQLLYGRWRSHDGEANLLFDRSAINDLPENDFVKNGIKYITVDAALEGADPMVIFVWSGWKIIDVFYVPQSNGQQVINHIKAAQAKHQIPNRQVCFDADGIGGFIKGYISGAVQFHGNGAVIKVNGERENFTNLRSQCFYHAAKKVNDSEAFYGFDSFFKELKNELLAHRTLKTNLGAFGIEPKQIIKTRLGGKSPNFADAFMMRSVFDLQFTGGSYSSFQV